MASVHAFIGGAFFSMPLFGAAAVSGGFAGDDGTVRRLPRCRVTTAGSIVVVAGDAVASRGASGVLLSAGSTGAVWLAGILSVDAGGVVAGASLLIAPMLAPGSLALAGAMVRLTLSTVNFRSGSMRWRYAKKAADVNAAKMISTTNSGCRWRAGSCVSVGVAIAAAASVASASAAGWRCISISLVSRNWPWH